MRITVRTHEWSDWQQTDDAGNRHQTCKWCKATRTREQGNWKYQESGSALVLDTEPQCIERKKYV